MFGTARERRSHKRRKEAVRELLAAMPPNGSVDQTVDRLAHSRRRPIHLLNLPAPEGSPMGLVVSAPSADYVVVDQSAPCALRSVAIWHELAHLVMGHEGRVLSSTEQLVQALAPDIAPVVAVRMLARSLDCDDEQELDAETVATWVFTEQRRRMSEAREQEDRVAVRLR